MEPFEKPLEPVESRRLEREHQRSRRLPRLFLDQQQHAHGLLGIGLAALPEGTEGRRVGPRIKKPPSQTAVGGLELRQQIGLDRAQDAHGEAVELQRRLAAILQSDAARRPGLPPVGAIVGASAQLGEPGRRMVPPQQHAARIAGHDLGDGADRGVADHDARRSAFTPALAPANEGLDRGQQLAQALEHR
jgi:hypothetical protein